MLMRRLTRVLALYEALEPSSVSMRSTKSTISHSARNSFPSKHLCQSFPYLAKYWCQVPARGCLGLLYKAVSPLVAVITGRFSEI